MVDKSDESLRLIQMRFDDREVEFLKESLSLNQWGPSSGTDAIARAFGFKGFDDMAALSGKVADALAEEVTLTKRDWTRFLLVAETSFSSEIIGAGTDWENVAGMSEEDSIKTLRLIQYKLTLAGALIRPGAARFLW